MTVATPVPFLDVFRPFSCSVVGLIIVFVASVTFLKGKSFATKEAQPSQGQKGDVVLTNSAAEEYIAAETDLSTDTLDSEAKEKFNGLVCTGGKDTMEDSINDDNKWRCACENGFLPPGLLKTFGGAEAVMRLGYGQCYHKQV